MYTKVSTWEKPTAPVYPPGEDANQPPVGPPPKYDEKTSQPVGPEKGGLVPTTNSIADDEAYARRLAAAAEGSSTSSNNLSEDEALARRLQEEENARTAWLSSYPSGPTTYPQQYQPPYQQQQQQPYQQQPLQQQLYAPTQEKGKKSGGFLSKLLGKSSSSSTHGYPQQHAQYGYAPQQAYGNPYGGRPGGGGGMGTAGAAALGVGGGLLAGALVADAINDNVHDAYMDGGSSCKWLFVIDKQTSERRV